MEILHTSNKNQTTVEIEIGSSYSYFDVKVLNTPLIGLLLTAENGLDSYGLSILSQLDSFWFAEIICY